MRTLRGLCGSAHRAERPGRARRCAGEISSPTEGRPALMTQSVTLEREHAVVEGDRLAGPACSRVRRRDEHGAPQVVAPIIGDGTGDRECAPKPTPRNRPSELSSAPPYRHPCRWAARGSRSCVTGRSVRVGEVPETVAGHLGGRAATLPGARPEDRRLRRQREGLLPARGPRQPVAQLGSTSS